MTVPKTGVLPITPWTIASKRGANLIQSFTSTNILKRIIKKKKRVHVKGLSKNEYDIYIN